MLWLMALEDISPGKIKINQRTFFNTIVEIGTHFKGNLSIVLHWLRTHYCYIMAPRQIFWFCPQAILALRPRSCWLEEALWGSPNCGRAYYRNLACGPYHNPKPAHMGIKKSLRIFFFFGLLYDSFSGAYYILFVLLHAWNPCEVRLFFYILEEYPNSITFKLS